MNLSRALAEVLTSPSKATRLLRPIAVLQSNLYSTTTTPQTKRTTTRKQQPKPPKKPNDPPFPHSDSSRPLGFDTNTNTNPKQVKLAWSEIESNEIDLKEVEEEVKESGDEIKKWVQGKEEEERKEDSGNGIQCNRPSTIPWQKKVENSLDLIGVIASPVQFEEAPDGKLWAGTVLMQDQRPDAELWIPLVFEGDMARTAAFHLKEKDLVHVTGQLSGDPLQFDMGPDQASMQVMVSSMDFVKDSPSRKASSTSYKKGGQILSADLFKLRVQLSGRSNQSGITSADIEHKDDSQLLGNDESTSGRKLAWGSAEIPWRNLVDNPGRWSDHRKEKLNGMVSPKFPDFKHMDSPHALWLDRAPRWVLSKLNELNFGGPLQKDKKEDSWKSLVENPNKWWDNRVDKRNVKAPDFKHKDTGEGLWLDGLPEWVLAKLPPGKSNNVSTDLVKPLVQLNNEPNKDSSRPQYFKHMEALDLPKAPRWDSSNELDFGGPLQEDNKYSFSQQKKDDKGEFDSWKNLVENPNKWWDNRLDKRNIKAPDFKHKDTGEGLWLNGSPEWVLDKLPPVKSKNMSTGKSETMWS